MAAVQQPQLHRLERRDVGDELAPRVLPAPAARRRSGPRSPTAGTARPTTGAASCDAEQARRLGDVGVASSPARSGRPSCDGNVDVAADPVGERRVDATARTRRTMPSTMRPLCGRLSQQTTVMRAAARGAPRGEPGDEHADAPRPAQRGLREVVHDVRVRGIERARRRVVAVALLGDRHRHDLDRRVGEARHQRARDRCRGRAPRAATPITRALHALAALLQHRVQPVLRGERVDRPRRRAGSRRRCPSADRRAARRR